MSSAEPPATTSVAGAAPGGQPAAAGDGGEDVGDVARGARGQERAHREVVQRGRDRGAVHDDLARAEAAQGTWVGGAPAAGPSQRQGQALGRDDQRDAVGDAQAEQGEGGGHEGHQGSIRVIGRVPITRRHDIMDLTNSTALVTGANRGIGRAIVEALAARPLRLVLAGVRDPDAFEPIEGVANARCAWTSPAASRSTPASTRSTWPPSTCSSTTPAR